VRFVKNAKICLTYGHKKNYERRKEETNSKKILEDKIIGKK
jgi:hypothetical protein